MFEKMIEEVEEVTASNNRRKLGTTSRCKKKSGKRNASGGRDQNDAGELEKTGTG